MEKKRMEDKIKELFEQFTPEEIADAFVFPSDLSEAEEKASRAELMEVLKIRRAAMTDQTKKELNLLQLKFQMQDYVKSEEYDERFSFASCLRRYIRINYKSNKDFAEDIHLKDTELSQILNHHRMPTENTMVRLEIHSDNCISALLWLKISQKEKEFRLQYNTDLRKEQGKYVRNRFQFANSELS